MHLRVPLLAVLALVLFSAVAASTTTGHGSVYVTTLPPGASVWVDGNYLGDTPLFVDGLDVGHHGLTLTRSGWQPQSTGIDVVAGRVASVNAVLSVSAPQTHDGQQRAKGNLSIHGAAGAKIFLDGVPLTAPYEAQPATAGEHILLVQRGAQKTTMSIRVYPETTTTVSLAPRASSSDEGGAEDMLAALADYVPPNDFTVNGDDIEVHHNGVELQCAVGSRSYLLNGRPGSLSVAPAMVGGKPYLPMSLLTRIAGQTKATTR